MTKTRSARILDTASDVAPGLLRLTVDGEVTVYKFRRDGDRVTLRKFRTETDYIVCLKTCRCTCPAFKFRHRCKHIDALISLNDANKI